MIRKRLVVTATFFSVLVNSGASFSAELATKQDDCSKFVQKFYDWYRIKSSQQNNKLSPLQVALRDKADCFSPDLARQLKEDLDAPTKSKEEVDCLDFDPILSAQDVASRYDVGAVTSKNEIRYVSVYGTWNGVKNKKPDVIAELKNVNGKWIFVNFDYEDTPKTNLLEVLKHLREQRKKPQH